jgi:hypothetical protein
MSTQQVEEKKQEALRGYCTRHGKEISYVEVREGQLARYQCQEQCGVTCRGIQTLDLTIKLK